MRAVPPAASVHPQSTSTEPSIDPAWRGARRVLAVRLDNLGDVLVTTPALRAIKQSLPGVHLTLLTSPVGAQVGRLNPDVDEVVVYAAPWIDPWRELPLDSARELALIETIRAGRYDAAVVFTAFRQSPLPAAYLCYLADVPLRLAASVDGVGSLLTTRHRHQEALVHEVERNLGLVAAVGLATDDEDLVLRVPDGARARVAAGGWWEAADGPGQPPAAGRDPLVVVHPGCSMPARTYPWEQFAAAIDALVGRLGARVVVTGDAGERALVERIVARLGPAARDRTRPCAGELPFPGFCALIEGADLVVTNNTGPMHVAAAVKTPVVALFALTNPPEQWGPWRVGHRLLNHDVPCRICYSRVCPYSHDCLRLVTPGQVAAAAADLLAEVEADRAGRDGRGYQTAEAPRSAPPAVPGSATIAAADPMVEPLALVLAASAPAVEAAP